MKEKVADYVLKIKFKNIIIIKEIKNENLLKLFFKKNFGIKTYKEILKVNSYSLQTAKAHTEKFWSKVL